MLPNGKNVSRQWLVVGLSAHGLAAALLLANVLSSSNEPGITGRRALDVVLEHNEFVVRVESATEALALGLSAPGFQNAAWQAQVEEHARVLGDEALPTLQALIADSKRSAEEHVAARELAGHLAH